MNNATATKLTTYMLEIEMAIHLLAIKDVMDDSSLSFEQKRTQENTYNIQVMTRRDEQYSLFSARVATLYRIEERYGLKRLPRPEQSPVRWM